ncbi:MAG: Na/Pi cotransporter family protein [Kiritimatiellae bacterium]|nr:Na/Pi cotransporter family protein [Kiritimatiellia bacterium]
MNAEFLIKLFFTVLGGLGIFLLGMKHMSEGMQAVAGARLRKWIGSVTDNRLMAVTVGVLVTCVVQSSSITTVMVVGFVNAGLMNLMQAIGVILGANIGTTITGWILAIKIGKYGLYIIGVFALIFLFSRRERLRFTGMAIMGIGMIFFGLELMSEGFKPLRGMPEFVEWFHAFQADTYWGVMKCAFVGCLLTAVIQSSSATLGITMGLAGTGVIHFETAAALVLGENIGTTITAFLASLGTGTNARRAAYAHITFNVIGVLWITALFPYYLDLIRAILHTNPDASVLGADGLATYPHVVPAIALVHTGFNVTNTLLFLPLMGVMSRVITRLVPDKETKETPHLTYLDFHLVGGPALAVVQSRKEVVVMADVVETMFSGLREMIELPGVNEPVERKLFQREERLDIIQKEVTIFLSQVVAGQVAHDIAEEAQKQLRLADEYESISDYIAGVLKKSIKLRKKDLLFSEEGRAEILNLHDHVAGYVNRITLAVRTDSKDIMAFAHSEGIRIHSLMKLYRKQHLDRLAREQVNPLASLVFTDMLNDYRRIKDHALNIAESQSGER